MRKTRNATQTNVWMRNYYVSIIYIRLHFNENRILVNYLIRNRSIDLTGNRLIDFRLIDYNRLIMITGSFKIIIVIIARL